MNFDAQGRVFRRRDAAFFDSCISAACVLQYEKRGERMEYRIFVVEDDDAIAGAICRQAEAWGYVVRRAADYRNVLHEFTDFVPHLVLMDVGLPCFDGYHWCAAIRRVSKVPVIFISSASDNMNILMALNMGGDDFIAKPFDLNVLTAKVQALLRRTYAFSAQSDLIECGGAVLNLSDATLTFESRRIELTKNEFRILELLMRSRGRVVRRDDIMDRLWETDSFIDDNTLTVNMARLRRKLEEAGLANFIATKKGIGYGIGL